MDSTCRLEVGSIYHGDRQGWSTVLLMTHGGAHYLETRYHSGEKMSTCACRRRIIESSLDESLMDIDGSR